MTQASSARSVFLVGRRVRSAGLAAALAAVPHLAFTQTPERMPPPADTHMAEVRAEIALLERVLPWLPDRGAGLLALAEDLAEAGDFSGALERLKQCIPLDVGFDPSRSRVFLPLHGNPEFQALVERARRISPKVSRARLAFQVAENELIPQGLAYDPGRRIFYLSSSRPGKIVKVALDGTSSDFFASDRYGLLPILGIRVDPTDQTIWANSFDGAGRTELLHLEASGRMVARYTPTLDTKHGFNDLVVRKNMEVIVTDSLQNQIYRFDWKAATLSPVAVHRPLVYPGGIALAEDDRSLFVADLLGVVNVDLVSGTSREVVLARGTLAGIDGLYWHRGSLVAIQNGMGLRRLMIFNLSGDGSRVTRAEVLENGTSLTELPTKGAIVDNDFYFIANSQMDKPQDGRIVDHSRLEAVRIGVVRIPDQPHGSPRPKGEIETVVLTAHIVSWR